MKYSWQNDDENLEQLLAIPVNDDKFIELIHKGGYAFGYIKD